jgi:ribonuclease HII
LDPRLQEPLAYERSFWSRGVRWVAGVDEVGRGPLAGPVLAAAVVLPEGAFVEGATDSKALRAHRREELHDRILSVAVSVGLGAASVREIDHGDILTASTRAMARALKALTLEPEHVVVDGLPLQTLGREHDAVVGGDAIVHSVGCASIVAKVIRDRLMGRLARRYPVYGWHSNVGYGTPEHLEALRVHGPSPHHRLTFTGLQYELGF